MKISLAIVLCLAALAYGRPAKKEGSPLVGKVLGFCLRLLEEAVDDPSKRSWDDVFGALAPVCEDLLKMADEGSESESTDDDGDASGDNASGDDSVAKRRGGRGKGPGRGRGSGSGDGSGDDSGSSEEDSGSGDDRSGDGSGEGRDQGEGLFRGLAKVCMGLHDLFEGAGQDKRSWEDIFMTLFTICEEAKAKVEEDRTEQELERRAPGGKGGKGKGKGGPAGGRGDGSSGSEDNDGDNDGDGVDDEDYRKGYAIVMNLIKLCEGLASLEGQDPPEDADPAWVSIFENVGEVCVATHEQIQKDMAGDDGSGSGSGMDPTEVKRMMKGAPRAGGKGKGKGGESADESGDSNGSGSESRDEDGSGRGSGDDGRGSGDDDRRPANPVEALLDICESLLELEKRMLAKRNNKVSVDVVAGLMKSVCDQAFAQAEADEKKKR